jgi:hypothetical protein
VRGCQGGNVSVGGATAQRFRRRTDTVSHLAVHDATQVIATRLILAGDSAAAGKLGSESTDQAAHC